MELLASFGQGNGVSKPFNIPAKDPRLLAWEPASQTLLHTHRRGSSLSTCAFT
jgi:hypothetical protein